MARLAFEFRSDSLSTMLEVTHAMVRIKDIDKFAKIVINATNHHPFIQAATRPPPTLAANLRPWLPMGK